MKVEVICPHCGKSRRIRRSRLGSDVLCRKCGRTFSVASRQSSTSGPPPPPLPSAPPPRDELQEASGESLPERIGRFRIQRLLGSGAFGTVYLADDPVLDRQVALKVLQRHAAGGSKALTRFLRESKIAAQLRHPQIVPVFDAGTDGQHHFIASAYVEGETLEEEIERDRPDPRRAAQVCQRLADALHYAHKLSIMHRDVKSSNVMVDPTGDVHLMDFGLARLGGSDERLTRDGAVLGTPAYMAPEQASTEFGVVGPQSDQYSLGVVLYELLCGQVPFSGPPTAVLYNVTSTEPATPRSVAPEVPRDLETICLKAMAKRPEQRYEDCSELAEDLRRWLADEAITARRVSPLERLTRWSKRNPIAALLIGTVAMLVLLTAIVPSVGYYVVAGQVAKREGEEGRIEDLERRNAEASKQLTIDKGKLDGQREEAERLRGEKETLTAISQDRQNKLDEMRRAEPLDVLLQTVREHIPPGPVPPELNLPPRKIPEDNSPPRQLSKEEPPSKPLGMPLLGKPKPLMIGQADELAAHVPDDCLYARFGSLQAVQWLVRSTGELHGPSGLEERLQTQLCLPHVAGESSFADRLVTGLAIVGTCGAPVAWPSNRPGGGVGIIIQARDDASSMLLGELVRWQRKRTLIQQPGTAEEWPVVAATQRVSHIKSTDGSMRVWSFCAAKGNFHLITNSLQIVEGFFGAGQGVEVVASAEGFNEIAVQKMQQEPKPYAMLFIPKAFWSEPELAKLNPLVGVISEMDAALDGHRSLSAELEVPSCWIELLEDYSGMDGPVVMPIYRLLAQNVPDTRVAPVPGDHFSLEIALKDKDKDTCRLFGGLRGDLSDAQSYLGIAGAEHLGSVLVELSKDEELGAHARDLLTLIPFYMNELLWKGDLDDEGYGGTSFLKLSRRVFKNGFFKNDWVALSPKKKVLRDVTPALKIEPAEHPATIRCRLNNATGAPLPKLPFVADPIADYIRAVTPDALTLDIAIHEERLHAYAKITWKLSKEDAALDWVEGLARLAPHRAEREILAAIDVLSTDFDRAADDRGRFKPLAMLHYLEQRLPSLQTVDRDKVLQHLRGKKKLLLDKLIEKLNKSVSSPKKRAFTLAESLKRVQTTDSMTRDRLRAELSQTTEWVDRLNDSLENAKELRDLWDLLAEDDGNVEPVRTRIDAKLVDMVRTLAQREFQKRDRRLLHYRLAKIAPLAPNTKRGKEAKKWIWEKYGVISNGRDD